jgi:hypothetical protein
MSLPTPASVFKQLFDIITMQKATIEQQNETISILDAALADSIKGFERPRQAGVAQLVEHLICNQVVAGSTPAASTLPS